MIFFSHARGTAELNPFQFGAIEEALRRSQVSQIFFTGDFPRGRIVQASLGRIQILSSLYSVGDEKCKRYFDETPSDLLPPVRYFYALNRLLNELRIKPQLASEIFPELNFRAGYASDITAPQEIERQLPTMVASVASDIKNGGKSRHRLAQSVVLDNNIVIERERYGLLSSGTDQMIQLFGRRRRKSFPVLAKLPSPDINPALDQPTIGPKTIQMCADYGVRGILICAETTTIVQKHLTRQRADEHGVFIYAMSFTQICEQYRQQFPGTWMQSVPIAP